MGVNSLPKTVTRQHRDCDLNPGLSVPESSTLTTRLPSHTGVCGGGQMSVIRRRRAHGSGRATVSFFFVVGGGGRSCRQREYTRARRFVT